MASKNEDRFRLSSVKERLKRWQEAAAASRPSSTSTPKPRPRPRPRPVSGLQNRCLADRRTVQENGVDPEGQMDRVEVISKSEELPAEPVYALPQKKTTQKSNEHQATLSSQSDHAVSPVADQVGNRLSKRLPDPSPSQTRRTPRKPLPYSKHKELASSPAVPRTLDTTDVVPSNKVASLNKGEKPSISSPRLDTMTPQPYLSRSRSSSLSKPGSPIISSNLSSRSSSITSNVHVGLQQRPGEGSQETLPQSGTRAERPQIRSFGSVKAKTRSLPRRPDLQRQASDPHFSGLIHGSHTDSSNSHMTASKVLVKSGAGEQVTHSQPPVPAQRPTVRPKPAVRPKTFVAGSPSHSPTVKQRTHSLVSPTQVASSEIMKGSSDRTASLTNVQEVAPAPAPRSPALYPKPRKNVVPRHPLPSSESNLEMEQKALRPDGARVTKPRPQLKPKPMVKPKPKRESVSAQSGKSLSGITSLRETIYREDAQNDNAECADMSLTETRANTGQIVSDAVDLKIASNDAELTAVSDVTECRDLDSKIAAEQSPPVSDEPIYHTVAECEKVEQETSLVASRVDETGNKTVQLSESLDNHAAAATDSLPGDSKVNDVFDSQEQVCETTASAQETKDEIMDQVGTEEKRRSATVTRFSRSIVEAATELQAALSGSSLPNETNLPSEDQENTTQYKVKRKAPVPPVRSTGVKAQQSPSGSPAISRSLANNLLLSLSGNTSPMQQKRSPIVGPSTPPARSSLRKRQSLRMPSIENASSTVETSNSTAVLLSPERMVVSQTSIEVPQSNVQSSSPTKGVLEKRLPETSMTVSPVATVDAVHSSQTVSPTKSSSDRVSSGGPPARPPPKPPRSIASQSVLAVSPVAQQQQQPHFPPASGAGHSALIHQPYSKISLTSEVSTVSEEYDEDSDGWGSEFDSDSQEEEVGPERPKVYLIAKEIVTTEETFVRGLRLLDEDFRRAVSDESGRPVIGDEMMSRILQNTKQLLLFNSGMLAELQERIENWDSCEKIGDIMKRNAPFLKLYTPYIQNFERATKALEEATKKSSNFEKMIREFERSWHCNNLPISAYMLETVQRIPRYKLLLQDYIKHLPEESDDRWDASDALTIVSSVAAHVNEGFKKKDNFQRMLDMQRRLTGKGSGDIVKPGREFLKEGKLMKVCRKIQQPRILFLFSDILLYTHELASGQYSLDATLQLKGMKVDKLLATQHNHAFTIVSTQKSFQLLAESDKERDDWLQSLKNAIQEHARKYGSFDPQLHYRAQAQDENVLPGAAADFVLGEMAPVWISDDSVSMCMGCMTHFSFSRRRHHCRGCGKVLCGRCSSLSHHLNYMKKAARVCVNCYEQLAGNEIKQPIAIDESAEVIFEIDPEDMPNQSKLKKRRSLQFQSRRKVISKRPAVLTEVQARDANSQMSGYLHVRLGRKWKRRWFVAHNMILYTYKRHEDIAALATMPLLGYRLGKVEKRDGIDKKEAELALKLTHPGTDGCILRTEVEEEFKKWWYVFELGVKGEIPPPEQQEELKQLDNPDVVDLALSAGSPASDPDMITTSPDPLSPVEMATAGVHSTASLDSGVYSYATISSVAQPKASQPARSPASHSAPADHMYEEIGKGKGGQFRVVHTHDSREETVTDAHQNVPHESTSPPPDESTVVALDDEQEADVYRNPVYGSHELIKDASCDEEVVVSQDSAGREYDIQANPLYERPPETFYLDDNPTRDAVVS